MIMVHSASAAEASIKTVILILGGGQTSGAVVEVEVVVLGSPFIIVRTVFVDVKQH